MNHYQSHEATGTATEKCPCYVAETPSGRVEVTIDHALGTVRARASLHREGFKVLKHSDYFTDRSDMDIVHTFIRTLAFCTAQQALAAARRATEFDCICR